MSIITNKESKFKILKINLPNLKFRQRKEELLLFLIIMSEKITKRVRVEVKNLMLMIRKSSLPYHNHNLYTIYIFLEFVFINGSVV